MTTDPVQPDPQAPPEKASIEQPQAVKEHAAESCDSTPSPASPDATSVVSPCAVANADSPGTDVRPREEAAVDTSSSAEVSPDSVAGTDVSPIGDVSVVQVPEVSSSDEAEVHSAAVRAREKMTSAADVQISTSEPAAAPQATGRGHIEIPSVDELDEGIEAEIAAAMTGEALTTPVELSASAEESADEGAREIAPGAKIKATVQAIHGGEIFLDAGLRQNVVLQATQFGEGKLPAVGDQLEIIVDSENADGLIQGRIPRARHRAGGNWDSLAVGQVVDCLVTAVNKGGLQVTVSNLRAFLPASQVELGFAGNLDGYVGQKISVQITEVNPRKRNLVVSRKALLLAERSEGEGEFWLKVEVGQDFRGTVKTLKDYGAFVNIGPVDGFLHIGEISWSRINHPKDVLNEGQEIDVKVLKVDPEKKRVSLGMKQLAQNPWSSATERYATGRTVSGKVTRITDFGAFVELEPGLEGMVHISELAWKRVGSVSEILKVGEVRDFQVVEVDSKRKRVSLSLKALEKRPEPPKPEKTAEAEPAPAEPRRPRNPNLRGGTGGSSGKGLFGNPSDFS